MASTLDAMRARCRELYWQVQDARQGHTVTFAIGQYARAEAARREELAARERLEELSEWLARLEAERREALASVPNMATVTEQHALTDMRG